VLNSKSQDDVSGGVSGGGRRIVTVLEVEIPQKRENDMAIQRDFCRIVQINRVQYDLARFMKSWRIQGRFGPRNDPVLGAGCY